MSATQTLTSSRRLRALGDQSTKLQAGRVFAIVHRCELVALKFGFFGEGGISRLFCLDVLVSVQRVKRADERTRTADLTSLRVCGQWLLSVAQTCNSRINKRFFFPSFARYCRVLRPG